jgi:hypothetical protein
MSKESTLLNHLNTVAIHFEISFDKTAVLVPDKFTPTDYPKRTQSSLKRLQKLGYHIQITIK